MYLYLTLFFLLGSAFGSFINMLVFRLHKGQSILGRSYCDFNNKKLEVLDLIPIFSYIFNRGKCRHCNKKLPLIYPIIELISGILTSFSFYYSYIIFFNINDLSSIYTTIIAGFILSIFILIFIFFAYFDYLYWEVESRSIYISIIFVSILILINFFIPLPYFNDSLDHIFAGAFLSSLILIIYILSNKGGMGEGDIYLFGLSGLMLGFINGLLAFVITVFSGSIIGIIKAIKLKKLKKVKIQLAPFIAFGTIISLLFGKYIIDFFY